MSLHMSQSRLLQSKSWRVWTVTDFVSQLVFSFQPVESGRTETSALLFKTFCF